MQRGKRPWHDLCMMFYKNLLTHIMHARYLPLLLLLGGPAAPALAHDLWLEAGQGGHTLYQGHRHSNHAGADLEPYDPAILQAARCGSTPVSPVSRGYPLRFADCPRLTLDLSSGYWTKTPWETRNTPKTGLSGVLRSWRAEERLTRLERWDPALARPLGDGLEILPTHDPFVLKPGDKLQVRVFEAGQPAAGVPVAYGDNTRGLTGPDGSINLRLRQTGLQRISTTRETPLQDGKADLLLRTSTLQFELPR